MTLCGENFIGARKAAAGGHRFHAFDPVLQQELEPSFVEATEDELNEAAMLAREAFEPYRTLDPESRARFLEAIAAAIEALGDALLERASQESGLPIARLTGERGRTTGQLRLFANLLREGSWVDARIDRAIPDRTPLPKPDLRRMLIPLGPVAVFGASNFPLAFSVAGGDTASALAAGCPVIVKAHQAHPGTSELVAEAILQAAAECGLPEGVFSMLHGGASLGQALVRHEVIQAVGFTGSLRGGRALFDAAAGRDTPVPVYAEMGSINPVFVLPGALADRVTAIAAGLKDSIVASVGQFCTNPGLVVGMESPDLSTLVSTTADGIFHTPRTAMLTPGIRQAYAEGLDRLLGVDGVQLESESVDTTNPEAAPAALLSTTADCFLANPSLAEENFGPSSLVVRCSSREEMEALARSIEGQLTASLHGSPEDLENYSGLVRILETKVGRLIFNGFPTGVEVCPSMQHGGPYPATTDSRTTSVGTAAILRWVRPVCYQNFPEERLPAELRNANIRGLMRMIDGRLTRDAI